MRIYHIIYLVLAALLMTGGCLTPEKAEREADETAKELAESWWAARTGVTNAFDVASPRDALAIRIALEAIHRGETNMPMPALSGRSPFRIDSNGVTRITLADAMALGARLNRKFRTLRETVYTKALTLDSERHVFETSFAGMISGALAGNPELTKESAHAGGDSSLASRKFEQGSTVAGNMAIDVAKMIRDDWHSFAWTGDLTMSVPLMRGSGRDIVREPLTQAERDLAYALMTFDRYRQTFALATAKAFFSVLEYAQNHRNSRDNAKRLDENYRRAEMMFKAGRMDRIQTDQAKTDLLTARQTMITTEQSYRTALDAFKITLGLPPESPVALEETELTRLENRMKEKAAETTNALADFPDEEAALECALSNRLDLAVTRGDAIDAERHARVAADALRADLTVEGGTSYTGTRRQHETVSDETLTSAKLKFSMPWDRRKERNAYRKALLTRDQAARTFEDAADTVKKDVREGMRDLTAARALYSNKVESWKTACMRVEANDLFMQSGRSSMRDILEAESALLTARNAMCSAFIDWWTSELELKCALGTLEPADGGNW